MLSDWKKQSNNRVLHPAERETEPGFKKLGGWRRSRTRLRTSFSEKVKAWGLRSPNPRLFNPSVRASRAAEAEISIPRARGPGLMRPRDPAVTAQTPCSQ